MLATQRLREAPGLVTLSIGPAIESQGLPEELNQKVQDWIEGKCGVSTLKGMSSSAQLELLFDSRETGAPEGVPPANAAPRDARTAPAPDAPSPARLPDPSPPTRANRC